MAAKFNTAKKAPVSKSKKVENLAGGKAYSVNPKFELASILQTSFVQDSYYRSANDTVDRVVKLLPEVGYDFGAKAAVYARNKFGMRSITHVVGGEVAGNVKGENWTKNFYKQLFHRPDDMLEIVSYYVSKYAETRKNSKGVMKELRPFPNALKRAIAEHLGSLSPYHLEKYQGAGKAVKLVDLARLCGPQATKAIKQLREGKFDAKDTKRWETTLSDAGREAGGDEAKVEKLKADAWEELLKENKLGYIALLKNCRNIIVDAPKAIPMLCKALVNEKAIQKSLVFPFQIETAKQQITDRKVITALSDAMDISLSNVPKFDGDTLVVIDVSGSMTSGPYRAGRENGVTRSPIQNAAIFGAALFKANDADLMFFHTSAKYVTNINPRDSLISISESIQRQATGGGTDFHCIWSAIQKKDYKRIVILSDMQGWAGGPGRPDAGYEAFCKKIGSRPYLYSFDLQGYGTLQFPEEKVFLLAGFSDKVFDAMKALETDRDAIVNEIEAITF